MDKINITTHLTEHQKYPASKSEIIESFRKVHPDDKFSLNWLKKNLTDLSYNSVDEAVNALESINGQSQSPY